MKHRLAARGILIGPDERILLALEQITPGVDEFWVLPGGGMEPEDGCLTNCVRREFREETGLTVGVGAVRYIEEFREPDADTHHLMLYFFVHHQQGEIHATDRAVPLQGAELKRHVQWFTRDELQTLRVYPVELRTDFWRDRADGITETTYLGLPPTT